MVYKISALLITVFMMQTCGAAEKNTSHSVQHTTTQLPGNRTHHQTVVGKGSKIESLSIGSGNFTFDSKGNLIPNSSDGVFVDGKRVDKK